MSNFRLSLLGAPCLERDGVPLGLGARKNVALVAYLAVTDKGHSREALVTLLWPELEPSRARGGLRRNLSELKKALGGELLLVDRESVGLDPGIDLARAEGRPFVQEYLETEPNRLSAGFRETLYQQTKGHPLFTVELLHGMQERGDLIQDSQGRWVEGSALDWETLPARVEAAIAERIDRLDVSSREALRVASVEGETFTAEVVAWVRSASETTPGLAVRSLRPRPCGILAIRIRP